MSKSDKLAVVSDVMPVAGNDFYKHNELPRSAHEVHTPGPSMTRQEFAAECDINTIMAQYDKYLSDPMMSLRAQSAYYIDMDAVPQTLMESMELLKQGEEAFYRLPAVVRREFDNNPVAFVDYALDPTNLEQMRKWGLAAPAEKAAEPIAVRIIQELEESRRDGTAPKGGEPPSSPARPAEKAS